MHSLLELHGIIDIPHAVTLFIVCVNQGTCTYMCQLWVPQYHYPSLLILQDDMLTYQSTSIWGIEMRSSPERILICRCVKGKQELEVCIYNTHATAM